ncbi:hypothetical protein O6H91_16G055500 [Diphasiastrum complanatum]|nr:hypothetical protein O6H91_16G055500 [Diphasiastrum complanatum]
MKDPVTLCTGQTYERANIQRWLSSGNKTCPITMVKLKSCDLIPNHTLRRLIQDYHLTSSSFGLRKNESPAMEVDDQQLNRLVLEMDRDDSMQSCVRTLCSMAEENVNNRCRIADAGAVPVLIRLFQKDQLVDSIPSIKCHKGFDEIAACSAGGNLLQEIICLLSFIPLVDEERRAIADPRPLERLLWFLHKSNLQTRIHAARLLRKIAVVDDIMTLLGQVDGVFSGLVLLIQDESVGKQGLKSTFKALFQICLPHCNRVKAVELGVVSAILETIPIARRKNTERGLAVISLLCSCDEGRQAVLKHPASFSILLQALHVSPRATESSITTLWGAVSFNANAAAEQFVWLHHQADSICTKLLLLLHGDYSHTAKYCAINLLKTLKGSCIRSSISGLDALDPPRQS